jgi:2-polyprenyl-3-methyl-5-hydroxy-6-metoxy-1,4-benzoquinol methylase
MAKKSFLAPIKKMAKSILRPPAKYKFHPSHDVIRDYAEFSGLSTSEIEFRINSFKKLTSSEWKNVPAESFAGKAEKFYTTSQYYICDILSGNLSKQMVIENMNRFTPKILESINGHPGKRFLEFGGGTGIFCDIVHHMGKDVTYLDLPATQYEFAKWRYKKYHLPIRQILTQPGQPLKLDAEYDIIYTDAVMEHIDDPLIPASELAQHLAPGGIFVMLVDLAGEEHDMPMHKDVDINALHGVLVKAGLKNTYGLNTFCSIWVRA